MIKYHTFTTQTELYEKVTEIISLIKLNEQSQMLKKFVKSDTIILDSDPFIEETTKIFREKGIILNTQFCFLYLKNINENYDLIISLIITFN